MTPPTDRNDGDSAEVSDEELARTTPDQGAVPGQRDADDEAREPGSEDTVAVDEQELARLRAQLAELESRTGSAPSGRRTGWWRPWVAGVLITIGALLAPLSIVAAWAHDEVSDT